MIMILQSFIYLLTEIMPLDGDAHQKLISYYYSATPLSEEFKAIVYVSLVVGILIYFYKDIFLMITDTFKGSYSSLSGRRSFKVSCTNYKMYNIFVISLVMTIVLLFIMQFNCCNDLSVVRVAVVFLIMAVLLRLSTSFIMIRIDGKYLNIKEMFIFALVQVISYIPGFSRTALLIGVGCFMGIEKKYLIKLVFISFVPFLFLKLFFLDLDLATVSLVLLGHWYLLMLCILVSMLFIKLLSFIILSGRFYKFYLYLAGIGIWTLLDVYFSKRGL